MWQIVPHPLGIEVSALLALIPLTWLLLGLGVWKLAAHKTCFVALILSAVLALFVWQMPGNLVFLGIADGVVLALWPIILVIFSAIFTYNMTVQTGAMDKIKGLMASFSQDRRVQALLIAWGFGAFLESAAGFGTAVAIPAAILISLGFPPFFASVVCLIANTVPVAFGGVGLPVITLAKVADVDVLRLTLDCAIQLTPFILVIPLALIWLITKKTSGFRGVFLMSVAAGAFFAVPQLFIAAYIGPELTSIVGSIMSMLAIVVINKISPPKKVWRFPDEAAAGLESEATFQTNLKEQLIAWSPYFFLLIFILGTNEVIFPALNEALRNLSTTVHIYSGPGGNPISIEWILTPGTLILLGSLLSARLQKASWQDLRDVTGKTLKQLQKTSLTVITIVAMAKIMSYSGMISDIAYALAMTTGGAYPFIAPIIGTLGTFVTGSDTNANVLFGSLQKQTALQIGADPTWITASNTSGATAGKMISPQSIAIATSATNQIGIEGDILRSTVGYCLIYTVMLGFWVFFVNYMRFFLG
ncbi:MAG: L-lactate permease [Sporomusaceae bacterium]|nr:L-lactate permease [Sporomusaceae bacterium]